MKCIRRMRRRNAERVIYWPHRRSVAPETRFSIGSRLFLGPESLARSWATRMKGIFIPLRA